MEWSNTGLFCMISHPSGIVNAVRGRSLYSSIGFDTTIGVDKIPEVDQGDVLALRKYLQKALKKIKGQPIHPLVMNHDPAKRALQGNLEISE